MEAAKFTPESGTKDALDALNIEDALDREAFPIILDCQKIGMAGSAFLDFLIINYRRTGGEKGAIELINVGADLMSILRTCKMDSIFKIKLAQGVKAA